MIPKALLAGLSRTRQLFKRLLTATSTEELEELLLAADVGVTVTQQLVQSIKGSRVDPSSENRPLRERIGRPDSGGPERREKLVSEITALLNLEPGTRNLEPLRPQVIMVVGVNGSGKTTTVGKLAHYFGRQGQKVLVAAADTFRDAAAEQLRIWTERAGVEILFSQPGQDSAAVAYDAISKAAHKVGEPHKGFDLVLIDTAGRLHSRTDLMAEIEKVKRVCAKVKTGAPDEVWLVLDATVGQNGLAQARTFNEQLGLTGIIVAKLDGTAKGGILLPIALELGIPIRFIGTGEAIDDLEPFDPEAFARALFDD